MVRQTRVSIGCNSLKKMITTLLFLIRVLATEILHPTTHDECEVLADGHQ